MRESLVYLYVGSMFVGLTVAVAVANDVTSAQTQSEQRVADLLPMAHVNWGDDLSGPLCGVYAACTAVELIGLDADPREFIASRYIGACGGSSPAEVARVAEDAGANAHVMTGLSAVDLRLIGCPLIANVRISPTNNRFSHWVVAVPSDDGMTIYDGMQEPYGVSTAAFLGSWSGIGICVSRSESSPFASIWLGRSSLLLGIGIAGVLTLRNRTSTAKIGKSSGARQLAALGIASIALSLAGNSVFGDLRHHAEGVAIATAPSANGIYALGTLEDAKRASASRDVLLIDARREQDYQAGTIAGAVNVPVTASTWAIDKYFKQVDHDTPIVVFCQSARCGYDESIGGQLASLGFSDVTVCDEGWAEYKQAAEIASEDQPVAPSTARQQ